jgi:transposase InsO family protein
MPYLEGIGAGLLPSRLAPPLAARSLTAEDLLETLDELFMSRGVPEHIRSDNGGEFTAEAVRGWQETLEVRHLHIEPGSPWENGYAESPFTRSSVY